ncbi:MAG: hypothetical protein E4H13_10185, partial [Calditrichales bacterium]
MIRIIYIIFTIMIFSSCSERDKDNPFDPSGDVPLELKVLSFDKRIELTWGDPKVSDYSGFNIYRKQIGTDQTYKLIAERLLPSSRKFSDYYVNYQQIYFYYITITGNDMESRPSAPVSITPGPGINWVADRWGYQVLRMTYDAAHTISIYETSWPPGGIAVSRKLGIAVIIYPGNGIVEEINFAGIREARYEQIRYPMDIAYDSIDSLFWIIDSSGILFTLDTRIDQFSIISEEVGHPIAIEISGRQNLINVIDRE